MGFPAKCKSKQINEAELQAVETAIRHDKRPEVRQRCAAIRLLHLGHKPAQVAEMGAVSIPTIYAWLKRWRKGGIEALATQPRSGRPHKADAAYSQLLGEVLEKEPAELGYGFTMWTIDRLRAHLAKETGIWEKLGKLRLSGKE